MRRPCSRSIALGGAVMVALAAGCESGDGAAPDGADAAGVQADPVAEALAAVAAERTDMAAAVGGEMGDPRYFHDGAWHLHYGDGHFYGPSWDLAEWSMHGDEARRARALEALETNLGLVEGATGNLLGAMDDLENISMALLGLIEAGQYIDEPRYVTAAEALVAQLDAFAKGFGDYLRIEAGEFAATTYGPTSISSFVALLHLELVLADPDAESGERAAAHVARAREVLGHVHDIAWDAALGAYRFSPDDARLMLYPNATMMLAWGRALELTGDAAFADRIAATWQGIQPLRAASADHYHSPYSAEEMGATDPDYATLSSQNYLSMALMLAWRGTGEQRYLDDLRDVLGWVDSHLRVEGRLLHHWVNGRVANLYDPVDFCAGCNLQALYILRLMEGAGP